MSDKNVSPINQGSETQVPNKQDEQVPEHKVFPNKCIVLSLIRHGESQNNISGRTANEDDSLTANGRQQAERLGKIWKDVHIDALYSSTLQRAYDTALQISDHNQTCPEVIQSFLFVERKPGEEVQELARAGQFERAGELYMGIPMHRSGATPRDYRPPRGGESPSDVALRAQNGLCLLLLKHGKDMEEPPKEFVDKVTIDSPDTLPEGIPHVVVVSHNIYLSELYETMLSWNTSIHHMTTCYYSNANWSRHILWLKDADFHLEFSDMRLPCEVKAYNPI